MKVKFLIFETAKLELEVFTSKSFLKASGDYVFGVSWRRPVKLPAFENIGRSEQLPEYGKISKHIFQHLERRCQSQLDKNESLKLLQVFQKKPVWAFLSISKTKGLQSLTAFPKNPPFPPPHHQLSWLSRNFLPVSNLRSDVQWRWTWIKLSSMARSELNGLQPKSQVKLNYICISRFVSFYNNKIKSIRCLKPSVTSAGGGVRTSFTQRWRSARSWTWKYSRLVQDAATLSQSRR